MWEANHYHKNYLLDIWDWISLGFVNFSEFSSKIKQNFVTFILLKT